MKLLLDVLKKKNDNKKPSRVPIWLMRQAGRYLPEYREVRKQAGGFLNLCYNPELASKVTLQPIERFGFDAAIIFSDILIVPHILGLEVEFLEGEGPSVQKVINMSDLSHLSIKEVDNSDKIKKVAEALSLTKSKLPKETALIGFAGSPWTVATYILTGKKGDHDGLRKFVYENKPLVRKLIDIISDQTILYLSAQIEAGAEVIQLFDSWAGILAGREFEEFVIEPNKKIVKEIKRLYPNIPIIGFPRNSGSLYRDYIHNIDVDCAGLDYNVPMSFAKELQKKVIVQGNLDPMVLLTSKEIIEEKAGNILSSLSEGGLIFNLGHGISKDTPIENVEFLVNYVKNWK